MSSRSDRLYLKWAPSASASPRQLGGGKDVCTSVPTEAIFPAVSNQGRMAEHKELLESRPKTQVHVPALTLTHCHHLEWVSDSCGPPASRSGGYSIPVSFWAKMGWERARRALGIQ